MRSGHDICYAGFVVFSVATWKRALRAGVLAHPHRHESLLRSCLIALSSGIYSQSAIPFP
jgi:hypothetical protein